MDEYPLITGTIASVLSALNQKFIFIGIYLTSKTVSAIIVSKPIAGIVSPTPQGRIGSGYFRKKRTSSHCNDTHFGNNQAGMPRTAIGHAHTVLSWCPRCSRITFRSNLQPIAVRSRCSRRTILIDTRPHASVIRQAIVVIVMYARYIAFLTEIQSLYRCSVWLYLLDNTCHIYIIQIHGVTIHVQPEYIQIGKVTIL